MNLQKQKLWKTAVNLDRDGHQKSEVCALCNVRCACAVLQSVVLLPVIQLTHTRSVKPSYYLIGNGLTAHTTVKYSHKTRRLLGKTKSCRGSRKEVKIISINHTSKICILTG
jgi:hypothetical protein